MKLSITVKQDKQKSITLDKVKHYYFDKAYLVCTLENSQKHWFKSSTVLEIQEV